MTTQGQRAQSTVDLKLISGQSLLSVLYLLMISVLYLLLTSLSTVTSQPLNLPAGRFPCGPLNVTCPRWGYTACVQPDGEYYCLPCDHENLKTLCGTKEEVHGCNLYCTQKAVDYEKGQLKTEFTREMEEIKYNFMTVLNNLNSTLLQNITDQQINFKKEKDLQENLILKKERDIREKNNEISFLKWILYSLFGGLVLSVVATVIFTIIWCRNCRKRDKTSTDTETPEQRNLLPNDESSSTTSDFQEENEKTNKTVYPDGQIDFTQTEDTNIKKRTDEQVHEQPTEEQKDPCTDTENGCPAKAMLQQIPPTIGQGLNRIATSNQNQDHDCDFKTE